MTSIAEALRQAKARLVDSDSAAADATALLCHVLACNSAHLAAWPEKQLDKDQQQAFERLLQRREQGEPVAYLRGEQEFWSRNFRVNRHTLIPRPETEKLIEFVLERFDDEPIEVADLGTGSGAIAITLACERPRWHITATDLSQMALDTARDNAARHGTDHIDFVIGDWFSAITSPLHLIVSNPPYIAAADPHLAQGDVRFEPRSALVAGADGLDAIRELARLAPSHLVPGGWLVVEHGYDQQQAVAGVLRQAGFGDIEQQPDDAGQPRLTAARRAD